LINVDADAWLDVEAIKKVVQTFENDPSLLAATGVIRVDKELGSPRSFLDVINYCEVVEYINAFEVGRRYQDMKNSLFSLSGAFSMFRRDVLFQSYLYQDRTVSEDTDLTYDIRKLMQGSAGRIGCIPDAVAYVEPIESMERLYSQRVRWQRGELEVVSAHYDHPPNVNSAVFNFTGRLLISDHTLLFLRLAWTFLLPFLYFLGYALQTVVIALIGMVICYQLLESLYFYVAYRGMSKEYRRELRKVWWLVLFLPFYRYLIYWFRMSGVLFALVETKSWGVDNPFKQLRESVRRYLRKL
jgi:putative glycosyltransferase (exosortase G-associated)